MAILPFVLSLYLQNSRGLPTLAVAVALSVDGLMLAAVTQGGWGRRWSDPVGYLVGAALAAGGMVMIAALAPHAPLTVLALGIGMVGGATALFVARLTSSVLAGAPSGRAGLSAGLNLAVARTAAAVGIALTVPLVAGVARTVATSEDVSTASAAAAPLGQAGQPTPSLAMSRIHGRAAQAGLGLSAGLLAIGAVVAIGGRRSLAPTHQGGESDQQQADRQGRHGDAGRVG